MRENMFNRCNVLSADVGMNTCVISPVQALKYPTEASHEPVKLVGVLSDSDIVISFQVEQVINYIPALARPMLASPIIACKRKRSCLRFYKEIRVGLAAASAP